MTFRISPEAEEAFDSIYERIAYDKPDAAADLMATLLIAIEDQLLRFPFSGRRGTEPNTRELVRPPYIIVYRIVEDVIDVLNVLHGSEMY